MEAAYLQTPPELIFPPQIPFSWTLRSAWARGLKARRLEQKKEAPRII